jgi:hypothetical protein
MIFGGLLAFLAAPMAAQAQGANCAAFPPTVVLTAALDPFGSSPAINQTFTYTISNPDNNAIDVVWNLVPEPPATMSTLNVATVGNDPGDNSQADVIVASPPTINVDSPGASQKVNFGGKTHTGSVQMTVNVPAGANIKAGTNSFFYDVYYACKDNGVKTATFEVPNGLEITFTVLNALKASFAGAALNFGDITSQIAGFHTSTTSSTINVNSSGGYVVHASSPNGFIMTPGGVLPGSVPVAARVGYTLNFLGQTPGGLSNLTTTGTWTDQDCKIAGITTQSMIPIYATLNEGGAGKTGGGYQDTVTLTFTPDNPASDTGSRTCP